MILLPPRRLKILIVLTPLIAAAVGVAVWHGGATPTNAQEPSPTPTRTATAIPTASPSATVSPSPSATVSGTPSTTSCAGTLQGGTTVSVGGGASVTLPAGGTFAVTPATSADGAFTVCHVESQARVTIIAGTCRETSESVPIASGAIVLARIVESCVTSQAAGATPGATQTTGGTISPPSTGDGGMTN